MEGERRTEREREIDREREKRHNCRMARMNTGHGSMYVYKIRIYA